jgi:Family of unknown function (DUF6345)
MKWTVFATLAIATLIVACDPAPGANNSSEKPVIQSFKANPDTSQKPGTVTLSWEVTGANKLEIDGGIGVVSGKTKEIQVSATNSFILTATNDKGSSLKSVIVEINVPEKLPLLKVITKIDPAKLLKLAEVLQIPDAKPDANGKIVFTSPDFQKLPMTSGGAGANGEEGRATEISNFDFNAIQKIQVLPEENALEKTRAALGFAGLNLTNATPSVDYSRFKATNKSNVVQIEETKIDTHVDYNFTYNNYALVGPGAKFKTAFDANGKATQLVVAYRELSSGDTRPIISLAKANLLALETIQSDAGLRKADLGKINLGNAKIVYYAPDLDVTPEAIYPHYQYSPSLLIGQETVQLRTLLIPATLDAPKATLTLPVPNVDYQITNATVDITGGTAPYQIEWTSSTIGVISTQGNDKVVSYNLLGDNTRALEFNPNNKETLQAVITDANGLSVTAAATVNAPLPNRIGPNNLKAQSLARLDVGTEWLNTCGGLKQSGNNAQGFVNRMRNADVPTQFNWGEGNAWERDFKRNGTGGGQSTQVVDDVDMLFYSGHANGNGWTLCDSAHDDNFVYYTETQYGRSDLEWLIIAACGPLQGTEGGKSWNERWGNTFRGLHLIMGYATTSYDGPNEGRDIANGALSGLDLRSAWINTAVANQPSKVTWSVMGVYGPGGQTSYNDHFWGQGSVSPDMGLEAADGKSILYDGWWIIWGPS